MYVCLSQYLPLSPPTVVEILVSPSSVSLLEDEGSVSLQVEKRGMTGLTTNLIINTRDATATGGCGQVTRL